MDTVFSIEKDKARSQNNIHGKAYYLRAQALVTAHIWTPNAIISYSSKVFLT